MDTCGFESCPVHHGPDGFCMILARSANRIAQRIHRSYGNVALLPSAGRNLINTSNVPVLEKTTPTEQGRWQHIGNLTGTHIFIGDHLPYDRAYVVYAPENDYGHGVLVSVDGKLMLATETEPTNAEMMSSYSDFFETIRIL